MAAIYVGRGVDAALAKKVADQLMAHDALGAHARDELGITPTLEARPIQAALASAASFILGAAIPLIVVALVPAASLLIAVPASSLVVLVRAQIVLLSAAGVGTNAIMRETGKSKTCVWRWQERFAVEGVDGLLRDKTRPSRIAKLDPSVNERVVALTMEEPPHEASHWTSAAMAEAVGISVSSVQRIWRGHGLQPHRVRQFKLSKDPAFVGKLRDIVGLYVDPPAHAVVLSVDEKSQIQALDRTQPGLPLKKGRAGTVLRLRASGRWLRGRAALEWRPALYGSASGARWPWASRQAQALCSARWFEIQAPSLASASRTMTSLKLSPSFRVARSCSTYCGSSQTY